MTVTKENLRLHAREIFKNLNVQEIHATEDGNYFEKKADAILHNAKYVKGEVHTFNNNVDSGDIEKKQAFATRDNDKKVSIPEKKVETPVTKPVNKPVKPAAKNSNKPNKGGKK